MFGGFFTFLLERREGGGGLCAVCLIGEGSLSTHLFLHFLCFLDPCFTVRLFSEWSWVAGWRVSVPLVGVFIEGGAERVWWVTDLPLLYPSLDPSALVARSASLVLVISWMIPSS